MALSLLSRVGQYVERLRRLNARKAARNAEIDAQPTVVPKPTDEGGFTEETMNAIRPFEGDVSEVADKTLKGFEQNYVEGYTPPRSNSGEPIMPEKFAGTIEQALIEIERDLLDTGQLQTAEKLHYPSDIKGAGILRDELGVERPPARKESPSERAAIDRVVSEQDNKLRVKKIPEAKRPGQFINRNNEDQVRIEQERDLQGAIKNIEGTEADTAANREFLKGQVVMRDVVDDRIGRIFGKAFGKPRGKGDNFDLRTLRSIVGWAKKGQAPTVMQKNVARMEAIAAKGAAASGRKTKTPLNPPKTAAGFEEFKKTERASLSALDEAQEQLTGPLKGSAPPPPVGRQSGRELDRSFEEGRAPDDVTTLTAADIPSESSFSHVGGSRDADTLSLQRRILGNQGPGAADPSKSLIQPSTVSQRRSVFDPEVLENKSVQELLLAIMERAQQGKKSNLGRGGVSPTTVYSTSDSPYGAILSQTHGRGENMSELLQKLQQIIKGRT